jgi:hypothetical protein
MREEVSSRPGWLIFGNKKPIPAQCQNGGLLIRYSDTRRENAHNIYQPLFRWNQEKRIKHRGVCCCVQIKSPGDPVSP